MKPVVFVLLGIFLCTLNSEGSPRESSEEEQLEVIRRESLALDERLSWLRTQYQQLLEDVRTRDHRYIDVANICEGRLTLQSGVAVPTSDQASKNILYFTPYHGANIALYDGSTWQAYTFTELSLTLSSLTAGKNYDVFVYLNSGSPALALSSQWTSDTARADALALQDGVYVLASSTGRRYVGTIRATSGTQTQDTAAQRFVWNYQNQVLRTLKITDSTNTWTYNSNTWRQTNATGTNRVEIVDGLGKSLVQIFAMAMATNATGTVNYYATGMGVDTTTANSTTIFGAGTDNNLVTQSWGEYADYPGIGYHALNWVERASATAITVWGDNNSTVNASGMLGYIKG